MAIVLFVNQLGRGQGHLLQMLPLADGLVREGHIVYMAFRDLPAAAEIYGRVGIRFIQAPAKSAAFRPTAPRGTGFASLLISGGFGWDAELFGLASAWRNLFRLIRPALIVFDHSPIALLAARDVGARRVVIGSGFLCPPDVSPLPNIRLPDSADREAATARTADEEECVLCRANWLLGIWGRSPMQRVAQLYSDVDETFLTTFPELDHFGPRDGVRYWGPINGSGGKRPEWPESVAGPRVFAYLKPFPALATLLDVLQERGLPTLVRPDGIDRKVRERFASKTLCFVDDRLDPSAAAAGCDLAILNAGAGTTCDVLLAGRPILQVPLHAEQGLTAAAVQRLGAGRTIHPRGADRTAIERALDELLDDPHPAAAARGFARRHADFDPTRQRAEMLARCCELIDGGSGVAAATPSHKAAAAVRPAMA